VRLVELTVDGPDDVWRDHCQQGCRRSGDYLRELASAYFAGSDAHNPLVSPIHADLRGLPPLLIQVGSAETLLDDSIRLARAAGLADVSVTLQIWPDMIHAFTLFYQEIAAARRALADLGDFVRRHIAG
jgi:acetyl esterase/lipase